MDFVIVYIFCIFLLFMSPKDSIPKLLSLFFVLSLTVFLLFFRFRTLEPIDILHAIWIIIVISMAVMPWKGFKQITTISVRDNKKVDTIATILIVICVALGISCLVLSYYVLTSITDINRFKYVDGTSDFYYSLGIDLHGFLLTTLLYPIGYLLIPYFFYYLSQQKTAKAILCFFGSMLPVFYGLTYFSRAHMIHFVMIYLVAYYLLRNVLSKNQKKWLKLSMVIMGIGVVIVFNAISSSRFEDHSYSSGSREIVTSSQSSSFVSKVDYFCMWWPNSQELFRRFDGQTMHNGIIIQSVNNFFSTITFGLIPNHSAKRMERRGLLLREYSGSFIGLGAYILYDQGPLLGLILLWLYGWYVRRQKPKGGEVSMHSLLLVFALIQVPLFAIFYSVMDGVLLTLVFMIPIGFYLRTQNT